ncbi:MAG: phosphoglucosamine mutase [Gemmatimonadota bacterium]|nr:MAG: phosphoglucosamine mutase [Gemmatimonadota bacterium]
MEFPSSLIVSVSGIRGRVGIDLNPEIIAGFAAQFGSFVRRQGWGDHLAIARDSRLSGPAFVRAATAGLQAVGCRVSDLGLVPTPTALLEIQDRELSGGIVVTASHNPREWNALKLASPEGAFLTPEQGAEFLEAIRSDKPAAYVHGELGAAETVPGAADRHIERVLGQQLIDPAVIGERGFRLVLDCTRGAGGVIMPALLERLGCEFVGIDMEPDGRFTREPEPVPQNLTELCRRVPLEGADLGMAVDPDADRLALVDESGRAIGEDFTLALATRLVLGHHAGPVVANLSTSQVVETVCQRAGAAYRQSAVGEANVAKMMREVGAVVGGEGNGGVIMPALHYTRDAPLAVALILQLLAETGRGLAEIVAEFPQYCIVKDRFPRSEAGLGDRVEAIKRAFPGAEVDQRDGVHLRWRERGMWLHCRPSGTEPILRVIAEGPRQAESEVRRLVAEAGSILGSS